MAMPANGPCGPENGGIPLSGLGFTPGGGPTGRPEAMVCALTAGQIDRDDLLRAGVDDVELTVGDMDALRPLQAVDHGLGRTRPAARRGPLPTPPPADCRQVERHADRVEQSGCQQFHVARPQRVHAAGAEFGEHDGVTGADGDTVELIESVCEIIRFAVSGTVAGDLAARGRDHEGSRSRRSQAAKKAGIPRGEQHSDGLQRTVVPDRIEVGAVGDVELPVVADGQVQRPVQSARQHGAGLAAGQDLGDLTGEVRDEQAVADEGQVVEPRVELGQQRLLTASRIDAQHLSAGHLGRDDEALRVELDGVGHSEVARDPLRLTDLRDSIRQISLAVISG